MSVQNLTSADKRVGFSGSLDEIQKLFPGAALKLPAPTDRNQSVTPVANTPAEIPAAPTQMPVDFSFAAWGRALKTWVEAKTHKDRDDAYMQVCRVYNAALAAGQRFGDRPKPEDLQSFAPAASSTDGIAFSHIKEILARKSRTEWLPGLKDILERKVLALLVAQRNTFKSFIALEWAMRGAVAGCGVAVLSGEGGGLDRRIDAWVRTHGEGVDIAKLKFVALEKPVNLNDAQVLTLVTDRVRELGWPLDLFVVDTLSKFTPGLEENDNTENAKFLTALSDAIRYQFDATVLLVAHAGHSDPGRPRGASTLMANPDAEYVVERRDMFVKVTRERLKDSPSLPPLAYQGKIVDLKRADENLRPITSLAFSLSNVALLPVSFKPLGGNQKLAWDALKGLLTVNADAPTCVPAGRRCVAYLTAETTLKGTFEGNVKPSRAAKLAIDDLVEKDYLARDAGWLWVTGQGHGTEGHTDKP